MTRYLIALTVLITLTIAACATAPPNPCEDYATEIRDTLDQWIDAVRVADATSRVSLDGPISRLQEIRSNARQMDVPECGLVAHGHLLTSMEATIDTYLAFMGQDDTDSIALSFQEATIARWAFYDAMTEAGVGAEFPTPCFEYSASVQPIWEEWNAAYGLYDPTNRDLFSGTTPKNVMSSLNNIATDLLIPECARTAHTHLLAMMSATLNGIDANDEFRTDLRDDYFAEASEQATLYQEALNASLAGSP